jgi:hypothetical protein
MNFAYQRLIQDAQCIPEMGYGVDCWGTVPRLVAYMSSSHRVVFVTSAADFQARNNTFLKCEKCLIIKKSTLLPSCTVEVEITHSIFIWFIYPCYLLCQSILHL